MGEKWACEKLDHILELCSTEWAANNLDDDSREDYTTEALNRDITAAT